MSARILVAEDNANLRRLVARICSAHGEVVEAKSGAEAIATLAGANFDLVVTDVKMPGADGFAVLEAARAKEPPAEVLMMTAYATIDRAVDAMKLGACDYLEKPFDPDEAEKVIVRALEKCAMDRVARILPVPTLPQEEFSGLVGRSNSMMQVFAMLERAAALELTVLLQGESGTGKELCARAIHERSDRKGRPFVAVNCGALPADLIESELFGHSAGAFTGATRATSGLVREAHGGTLFLDEIGDLPAPMQVKLNRVLAEKKVRGVGEEAESEVDLRVVAATLRDLKAEVEAGRFREDLYYRLAVFPITLPPLRDRKEDIPLLAAHMITAASAGRLKSIRGVSPEALALLAAWPFPGNARELRNIIERSLAFCEGERLEAKHLPIELQSARPGISASEALAGLPHKDAIELVKAQGERRYLDALLQRHAGNVSEAAKSAKLERESLHRLLKKHGISARDFR